MKLFLKRLFAYVPTPLPVGMTEFKTWSDDILELTGKLADADSLRWALAVSVLHLGETCSTKPKNYFVRRLRKGASNQVVSQAIQDIKEKQKAAQEAAKQPVEATTPNETVASNAAQSQTAAQG